MYCKEVLFMNKRSGTLLCAAAAAAAVPLWLLMPGRASAAKRAPFTGVNFAHRGLHSRDRSIPENSLEAFRLAAEAGYGMELDVQLSKDGKVVVFHDDDLLRVCGMEGKVCERTFGELSELRLCGTEQRIPLFSDVLSVIDGRGPLIVELKPGKSNRELCEKTNAILSGYSGEVCIESFDPNIVKWFRLHARKLLRGQLAMPAGEYAGNLHPALRFALSRCFLNFLGRPQFIAYETGRLPLAVQLCHKLGAMNVCWTSHEPSNENGRDGVIFEYYRPRRKFRG